MPIVRILPRHSRPDPDVKGVEFQWKDPLQPLPNGTVLSVMTDEGKVVWDSRAKNCFPPTSLLSEMAIIWGLSR